MVFSRALYGLQRSTLRKMGKFLDTLWLFSFIRGTLPYRVRGFRYGSWLYPCYLDIVFTINCCLYDDTLPFSVSHSNTTTQFPHVLWLNGEFFPHLATVEIAHSGGLAGTITRRSQRWMKQRGPHGNLREDGEFFWPQCFLLSKINDLYWWGPSPWKGGGGMAMNSKR